MKLIYETTDKQKKEFQHGLYHKILKDLGIIIKKAYTALIEPVLSTLQLFIHLIKYSKT